MSYIVPLYSSTHSHTLCPTVSYALSLSPTPKGSLYINKDSTDMHVIMIIIIYVMIHYEPQTQHELCTHKGSP